jgi:hypothetical protein
MKPVTFLQKLMLWLLIALLTTLFVYAAIVKLASLTHANEIVDKLHEELAEAKSYELVAEFNDGKVQLYRVVYHINQDEICYLAIGYLHGYTITLDCNI